MPRYDEKKVKALYEKTFGTPDGQALLKFMVAEYVEPELGLAAEPHQFYYLSGKKDLVLDLIKMTNYPLAEHTPEEYYE